MSVPALPTPPPHERVTLDGSRFSIEHLALDDEEACAFLRARLDRETPGIGLDILRKVRGGTGAVAFVARIGPYSVAPGEVGVRRRRGEDAIVGAIVVDVSALQRSRAVGISWVTVVLAHRGLRIGSELVSVAEGFALGIGAAAVQTPAPLVPTKFFHRLGYATCRLAAPRVFPALRSLHKNLPGAKETAKTAGRPTVRRAAPRAKPRKRARPVSSSDEDYMDSDSGSDSDSDLVSNSDSVSPLTEQGSTSDDSGTSDPEEASRRRADKPVPRKITPPAKRPRPAIADDAATLAASRKLTSRHNKGAAGISAKDISKGNTQAQWLGYSIPELPAVCAAGEVTFRLATPEHRRAWCALVLAACHYNLGGSDMMAVTLQAACRIVAVKASDEHAIVGLVAMQASGWVSFIACDDAHRDGGLGSFLLFLAMEWLRVRAGAAVSLTPLNKKVMSFYHRWGFCAYPSIESRKKSASGCSAAEVVMERTLDRAVYLLPDGKPLSAFVEGYDASDEVADTSRWYYHFYRRRSDVALAKKVPARAKKPTPPPRSREAATPRKATTPARAAASPQPRRLRSLSSGVEDRAALEAEAEAEAEELRILAARQPRPAVDQGSHSPQRPSSLMSFFSRIHGEGRPAPAPSPAVLPSPTKLLLDDEEVEPREGASMGRGATAVVTARSLSPWGLLLGEDGEQHSRSSSASLGESASECVASPSASLEGSDFAVSTPLGTASSEETEAATTCASSRPPLRKSIALPARGFKAVTAVVASVAGTWATSVRPGL